MKTRREVVITGLGVVSPIGIGREAFAASLHDRQSGVDAIQQYDTTNFAVRIGAELKDFEPKLYVKPRKSLKVMSREIQMGVASATLAVEEASLDVEAIDVERFGVVYGSPMLYADIPELTDLYRSCVTDEGEFSFELFGEQFSRQMVPLWMLKYLPNMTGSHIGISQGARGPNNTVVQGDLSSLLAMIEATSVIERGIADVMLTGGAGSRLSLTPVVYRGHSNLSHRNEDPTAASRPFDANRDGMVLGEGAVTVVLEERAHAEQRGAPILAEVLGYATTHTGRDVEGGMQAAIERSITRCLSQSDTEPKSVGQVNAHGSSEIEHDRREAAAIRNVLDAVPITAPKSFFGNVGAASGAMEMAASMMNGAIPPTLNFETPDEQCNVNVSGDPQPLKSDLVLKLNQNATGQAAGVLIRRV